MAYLQTDRLSVGYNRRALIHDIEITVEKGEILTLIGSNGAGKSTILKSIVRQLAPVGGAVLLSGKNIRSQSERELARQTAVVLTDRVQPELMTCAEVVAMGRYPHTDLFGRLTAQDKAAVANALARVHAVDLAQCDFSTLSDGQRQRVLLARAICQEPQLIVLDEPTAYLDIRYKIELLDILRDMARNENITVILSLHEIDLAMKLSDKLLCVKGDTIAAYGSPEEIFRSHAVEQLYDLQNGSYNRLFGSVELSRPQGEPQVFVIAGGGFGIEHYRALQKRNIPFATGILFENDVDHQVARALSSSVVSVPAFEPMTELHLKQASQLLLRCGCVIDAGTPVRSLNRLNGELLKAAERAGIPIVSSISSPDSPNQNNI